METRRRQVAVTRLHRTIVRTLAPREEADAILEDLDEEGAQVAASRGVRAARRWVRWQIAHSAWPWMGRRLQESIPRPRRGAPMMLGGLWSDIRIAARRLAHSPGFTALAGVTLAIGICAVSTVFSLAYALWLKPLPYFEPDRLVWISARHEPSGTPESLTTHELAELQHGSTSLSAVAGLVYGASIARVNDEPVRIVAHYVSPNLFRVLGVRPARGRDFVDRDAAGSRSVMLSHRFWTRRFARDPDIIGKAITLDNAPYEIIGLMPEGFAFPRLELEADAWIASGFRDAGLGNRRIVQAVARLAPDRSIADAEIEADTLLRRLAVPSPDSSRWTAGVRPAGVTASRANQLAFQALLGIVGLFQLIGCTNLAGLLLARNAARRTELAVCLSIGASQWRLARLLLVESTLLSSIACAAGVLFASYAARLLSAVVPAATPGLDEVRVNGPVIAITAAISLASALLVGLQPALGLRSMRPAEALAGSRTVARGLSRAQRVLMVTQIALSVVLVVGAGVMLRAFRDTLAQDRGFDPRGLAALDVSLPFSDDSYLKTETRARAFGEILERVAAVPGVRAAAAATGFPGSRLGVLVNAPVTPPGRPQIVAAIHAASPGYFTTMRIPIKAGRAFTASDATHAPAVAIVNEELAREFPNGDPIGHRIMVPRPGEEPTPFEIVGVAGNIRLSTRIGHRVFVPLAQASPYWIDLVVRGDQGAALLPSIRQALRRMNPNLLIENDSSFRAIISDSLAFERAQSAFAAMTGFLSVIVAGVGLYALVAFLMTQRRRELSIRLALGSPPGRLFQTAMSGALRLVAIGIVAGEIATALLVRALGSRVFGLASADVFAYAGAAALVLLIAMIAISIPARRALRTDALTVLRAE